MKPTIQFSRTCRMEEGVLGRCARNNDLTSLSAGTKISAQSKSIREEIHVYTQTDQLMKSRALNRSSKLNIYKSLIRPTVTYGCEAWTLTNRDEQHLRIFERRILRKIFGSVQK